MAECCSICRDIIDNNKQHYTLKCNHNFHTECIIDSLRCNNECPVCRDTDGYKSFNSSKKDEYIPFDNNNNKKKISKTKQDDINYILKLMNDIIESNIDIKKLKREIKNDIKIFKKSANNIHRNIYSFQNNLDKKYKDDINKYLLCIATSENFENGLNIKNICLNKITELHKYIYNEIIKMGIPNSALDSLNYNSIIKNQFEKNNSIYVDSFYHELYKSINKNIKKVNNNNIITI